MYTAHTCTAVAEGGCFSPVFFYCCRERENEREVLFVFAGVAWRGVSLRFSRLLLTPSVIYWYATAAVLALTVCIFSTTLGTSEVLSTEIYPSRPSEAAHPTFVLANARFCDTASISMR